MCNLEDTAYLNMLTALEQAKLRAEAPGLQLRVSTDPWSLSDKIMFMPKKHRVVIYEYLFKEGVMVAKKDTHAPKHPELDTIPNLHVIKTMQSLKSRGYVKEQFAWRHYYWYLTNEGIEFLRTYLHLPPEIVPATLKRQPRTEAQRPRVAAVRAGAGGPEQSKGGEDRAGYRRAPAAGGLGQGGDKKADVGAGTGDFEFRGGFGRGKSNQ